MKMLDIEFRFTEDCSQKETIPSVKLKLIIETHLLFLLLLFQKKKKKTQHKYYVGNET